MKKVIYDYKQLEFPYKCNEVIVFKCDDCGDEFCILFKDDYVPHDYGIKIGHKYFEMECSQCGHDVCRWISVVSMEYDLDSVMREIDIRVT